jgi:hypothetical protein
VPRSHAHVARSCIRPFDAAERTTAGPDEVREPSPNQGNARLELDGSGRFPAQPTGERPYMGLGSTVFRRSPRGVITRADYTKISP